MSANRFVANFKVISRFFAILVVCGSFCSCTVEHAEETILATHANGAKKTSIWIYPDGTILKRNEWYSDGIKEYEIPYKDSVPHGEFKRWTGYGDLVLEGEYKKGLRHGKWTSYYGGHFNKKTEAIRYYKEDHPIGDWEGWHFNGEKAFEEHYNDKGDSVGLWKKWYENGKLAEENSCFRTIETGSQKSFRNDGTLEFDKQCTNGIFAGKQVHYYSDGKRIQWEDEFRLDPYGRIDTNTIFRTFYYGDGHIQKEELWDHHVSKNIREYFRKGVWKWYDFQGNLIKESLVHYDTLDMHNIIEGRRTDYGICGNTINDTLVQFTVCAETTFTVYAGWKLHGTLWHYKQDHNLRYEEDWKNGALTESRSYYIDTLDGNSTGGILASQGFWAYDSTERKNKRHGIWRNWYPSGILKDSLTYVNGERVGDQFSYDSTGKLTIHKTENGKNRPVIMHILGER